MQDSLQIFTSASGEPSARILFEDNTVRHLHSTVMPEEESVYFSKLSFWGDIVIFAGTGLGWHLINKAAEIPHNAILIIIDYYKECVDECIKRVFSALPNKIFTLNETEWEKDVAEISNNIRYRKLQLIQVIKHPASYHMHKQFYTEVLCKLQLSKQEPALKRRRKPILLYGDFFIQEEIRRAVEKEYGTEPALFNYERISSNMEYESHLQKILQTEKPDFILSVNMKGFDGSGILAETAQRFDIPVIVWFVDDPHPILLHQRQFVDRNMKAFCWEKTYIPFLRRCGFSDVKYLPLAADPSMFYKVEQPVRDVKIGFVGSSMGEDFLGSIKSKFLWSDKFESLAQNASDRLLENPHIPVQELIKHVAERMSIKIPFNDIRNFTWLCSYIIHTASLKKRTAVIESLIPFNIETFGDPDGWRKIFQSSVRIHPDIDYRYGLCDVYRGIEINLNITSCQMLSAVNQRVFDIPLTGSFVISDRQKDMSELFEIGNEAVCYSDVNELKELVKFYLKNKGRQLEIINSARSRILDEHTYQHRIKTILKKLF